MPSDKTKNKGKEQFSLPIDARASACRNPVTLARTSSFGALLDTILLSWLLLL